MSHELTAMQQQEHDSQRHALIKANQLSYDDALDYCWFFLEHLEDENGDLPDWVMDEVCDALFELFDPSLETEDNAREVVEYVLPEMEEVDNERV